jgi:hypothetical protein
MKLARDNPNLFVVDTPHQLLNAIEAAHSFQLNNNHLVVVRAKNADRGRFMSLINTSDWASVSFPAPLIDGKPWVRKLFGQVIDRWYCRYLHLQRMRILAKLTERFSHVNKLFLGHYFAEEKPYMRHIANIIEYEDLYLLDDGTDTIEINKSRQRIGRDVPDGPIGREAPRSGFEALKRNLRLRYWDWHLDDIPSVTFFSIYNVDIRKGDSLIKNDYRYLKSLAPAQNTYLPDTVIFIGQCIVSGDIDLNVHLNFLAKIREYLSGSGVIYVAHPRDSASCLEQIREHLQCEIWPSSSVIERDLVTRGIKPKAIAGFVSSALITLAHIMDRDVEIICFHLPPEYWIRWREEAIEFYEYIGAKVERPVTIVPLSGQMSSVNVL